MPPRKSKSYLVATGLDSLNRMPSPSILLCLFLYACGLSLQVFCFPVGGTESEKCSSDMKTTTSKSQ